MALKLEDLKAGEIYLNQLGEDREVLFVGEYCIFYKRTDDGREFSQGINESLLYWSLKPKPKKTIELVLFRFRDGEIREVEKSTEACGAYDREKSWHRISSRVIECDE